jgi:Protein of unknown function (DUF3017)
VRADRSPFTLRAAFGRQAVLILALPLLAAIVVIGTVMGAPFAGRLLAGLLGVLALLRASLPVRAVGALAVRSRLLDVGVLTVLAIGIAVLSAAPNL